ncbi:acyltransferase domain-containing protein [Streptomyces stramineus]
MDGTGLDAAYWTRNLRGRVHFHEAVLSTAAEAPTVFVEMSPHPVLSSAVQDSLADAGLPGTAVGSLVRDEPERETLLAHLGKVYQTGAPVDWDRLYGAAATCRCPPTPGSGRATGWRTSTNCRGSTTSPSSRGRRCWPTSRPRGRPCTGPSSWRPPARRPSGPPAPTPCS